MEDVLVVRTFLGESESVDGVYSEPVLFEDVDSEPAESNWRTKVKRTGKATRK